MVEIFYNYLGFANYTQGDVMRGLQLAEPAEPRNIQFYFGLIIFLSIFERCRYFKCSVVSDNFLSS